MKQLSPTSLPEELLNMLNLAQSPLPVAEESAPAAPSLLRVRQAVQSRIRQQYAALHTLRAHEAEWEIFVPGVHIKVLHRDADQAHQSYLLKLEPGAVLPPHHHRLTEECVVLQGELQIGDIRARAGTYHRAPAQVDHASLCTSEQGALIYLRGGIPAKEDVIWGPAALWSFVPLAFKQSLQRVFKGNIFNT